MRKERPFLAAFKSEIHSQEVTPTVKGKNQPESNDIDDKKSNENAPSTCARYQNKKTHVKIAAQESSASSLKEKKKIITSKPSQKYSSMGNSSSKSNKSTAQNQRYFSNTKAMASVENTNQNMKDTVPSTTNTMKMKPVTSKEYEEGECETSSDEDIIAIDENGEKLEDRPTTQTTRSQIRNKENDESQKILCQFNKISITIHDYQTLKEEEYLNDTIIDFYLSYLYETILPAAIKDDVHIYSSHFYSRIKGSENSSKSSADKKGISAYQRVKSWTRKLDIFSKRMLLFPICEEDHWYLIIVCNPGFIEKEEKISNEAKKSSNSDNSGPTPCILMLDSLGLYQPRSVGKIRSYLYFEYLERKGKAISFGKDKLKLNNVNVPLQPNECDCGIYLLYYVELIFGNLTNFIEKEVPDLSQWFPHEDIHSKRMEISSVIQKLSKNSSVDLKSIQERQDNVRSKCDDEDSNKPSSKDMPTTNEDNEPCMLFRSPPREIPEKKQTQLQSSFQESTSRTVSFSNYSKCDDSSSYDKSDNVNYFTIRPRTGIISRVANAFNESSSKRNFTSTKGCDNKSTRKRDDEIFSSADREYSNNKKRLKQNNESWKDIKSEFKETRPRERVVILQPEGLRSSVSLH